MTLRGSLNDAIVNTSRTAEHLLYYFYASIAYNVQTILEIIYFCFHDY